ncbi:hypothetical protein ACM66B_007032 [Microbotryomycetes sp. NB124-2]
MADAVLTTLPPRLSLRSSLSSTRSLQRARASSIWSQEGDNTARLMTAYEALVVQRLPTGLDPVQQQHVVTFSKRTSFDDILAFTSPALHHEVVPNPEEQASVRSTSKVASFRKRHARPLAASSTALVIAIMTWFIVELVLSLVSHEQENSAISMFRKIELAILSATLLCSVGAAFALLQPTKWRTQMRFVVAIMSVVFGALSACNLMLVIILRSHLMIRCSWNIDITWTTRRSGGTCEGWKFEGWSAAAVLRLLFTIIIGYLWTCAIKTATQAKQPAIVSIATPSLEYDKPQFATHRQSWASDTPTLLPLVSPREQMEHLLDASSMHESSASSSHEGRAFSGSSGSTQGNLVYVRMLSGQLVRKVSTIASFSETRRQGTDSCGSAATGSME